MRTRLLLAAALLLPGAAAAQTALADPIPLHPGVVDAGVYRDSLGRLVLTSVTPGSPAQAAGLASGLELLAVDGRPVATRSLEEVRMALVGPVGSAVELTVLRRGERLRVPLRRGRYPAPAPGYTQVVVTPRFVVHHRAEQARRARELANEAERHYAAAGLPLHTQGRRAHLWLRRNVPGERLQKPEVWASFAAPDRRYAGPVKRVFGYLAYGPPGSNADYLKDDFLMSAGPKWVREAHLRVAHDILAEREARPEPGLPDERYRGSKWASDEGASLKHYVLDRYGVERFRRLWRSDLPFADAVPRALGVPAGTLIRDWRAYVVSLGPNPRAGVELGTVAVTLGWGMMALLYGAWTVRRKEVG